MKKYFFLGFILVLIICGYKAIYLLSQGCFSESGKGDGKNGLLCFYLNTSYFLLVNLAFLFFAYLLCFTKVFKSKFSVVKLIAILLIFLSGLLFVYRGNILYFGTQIQNYGYEFFTISFFQFFIISISALLFAIFFKEFSKDIFKGYLVFLLFVCIIFTVFGRQSNEHYFLLIDYSLNYVSYLLLFIIQILVLITFIVLELISNWIKQGKFTIKIVSFKYCLFIILAGSVVFSSLLFGKIFKHYDVKNAKKYIEEIIPKVQEYQKNNFEFPKDINFFEIDREKPLILRNMDYLSDMQNSFYFSKKDKFCFVIFETGLNNRYHSITSNRNWQKSHYNKDLSKDFFSICDESSQDYPMQMVEKHLGIPDEDDYSGKILHEAFGGKLRPNQNLLSSQQLEKELEKLNLKQNLGANENLNTSPLPVENVDQLKEYIKFLPKLKQLERKAKEGEPVDPKELMEDKEFMQFLMNLGKNYKVQEEKGK